MNKRILMIVLLVVSFLSISYAVYRSTALRITVVENGHEVVYGEPQHGLILGLCIFSGICIICAIVLLLDRREALPTTTQTTVPVSKKFI